MVVKKGVRKQESKSEVYAFRVYLFIIHSVKF